VLTLNSVGLNSDLH